MADNILYYGDNLYWLRRMKDETVDLIYLDPPFNSNRNYNVLFKDEKGTESEAQIMAFEDTWHWNQATELAYAEIIADAPSNVVRLIAAFREAIGANQMLAYLVMMTVRLVELRRVLKPTGSLYLHCDPTASHYLKVILDGIFGPAHFRNEIVWKRSDAHNDTKQGGRKYGRIHDTLLFYTRSDTWIWNPMYSPLPTSTRESWYRHSEEGMGRRYNKADLTAAKPGGDTKYAWKGMPPPSGRYWAYSREKMEQMDRDGRLVYSESGRPYMKRYLDESQGIPPQDLWTDIEMLRGITGKERLSYPTQKPLALLERIIQASSNPGEVVLDPFCGCGTAVAAAQKLGRRWIGIDITHLSIALLKYRLEAMFPGSQFRVEGEPTDLAGAKKLAQDDRYQFQFWACSLVRAKPLGGQVGSRSGKKGSDRGVDGIIDFEDDANHTSKKIIVQVKSGHVKSGNVRDLLGTIQREKAEIGVFLTLEPATREMLTEAASAGFYTSPWGKHPRLQILTIEELLDKKHPKKVEMPPQHLVGTTFKQAQRAAQTAGIEQGSIFAPLTVGTDAGSANDDEPEEETLEEEDA